jgi:phospholipid/cholesterol/gamma-HCH transport system substrate-binding protein
MDLFPGDIVMSARFSAREIWVGLVVLVAIAGLIGLVGLASDGPGFLAPQRTIDVIFRDAQGVRVGSPVRVAGLDTGSVVDTDMVEVEGTLRAKVRISLPANLVKKLREDMKVTIQPALTGMSHVNIVSAGRTGALLAPGKLITGVETSLFDPIIEQVGLGPGERNDIKHMIAEIRQTVDAAGPRLRQFLASLDATSANMRDMTESIRPAIESTIGEVEDLAKRIRANTPRIESAIARVNEITGQVHGIVAENRENVRQTMASVRDLTATMTDVLSKDRLKVERLLDGLDVMRARSERVLYQADQIAGQFAGILNRGRTEIQRSVTNVRDATDWGNKLVQKIYANPFVLSPFYKPNHEDLRIQGVYDTALVFTHGAQELTDAAKTLETLALRTNDPQQQQEIHQLQKRVLVLTNQLAVTSQQLNESLKQAAGGRERMRR